MTALPGGRHRPAGHETADAEKAGKWLRQGLGVLSGPAPLELARTEPACKSYCATAPSLAALERRVHVVDPGLLPDQVMVEDEAPDDLAKREITLDDLPFDWRRRESRTQRIGDAWLDSAVGALLVVPSVIVPVAAAPDRNVLINHRRLNTCSAQVFTGLCSWVPGSWAVPAPRKDLVFEFPDSLLRREDEECTRMLWR